MTTHRELIPIPSEEATVAEQRAITAEQEAAEARQRAERLAGFLPFCLLPSAFLH
ncbi:MAG TPA: hypothetical protein V6D14_33095 [Coleofasciculaceae cyanobacterium]